MVSTRRHAPSVLERSMLQLERDHVASQIDFSWPPVYPGRLNEDSRGIRNGGNTCYQNSVMQTFLHQAPFMRWIFTHHTDENPCWVQDCLKCYVKQIIQEYWDEVDPAYAVTYTNNDSESINTAAVKSHLFAKGAQEDAVLFYNWLHGVLNDIPHLLTAQTLFIPEDATKRQRRAQLAALRDHNRPFRDWQAQHDTLYRLDIQCTDTCRACGSIQHPRNEESRMLTLGVYTTDTTIYDAITGAFAETMTGVHCNICQANRTKDRVRHILAAPKVLAVHFQILDVNNKSFHALTYPEHLDLTTRQTHTTLPLKYHLTGVVSHGGNVIASGHYIASVRGRVPGDFMCISDDDREDFNRAEMLANPQMPTDLAFRRKRGYQVYMCMYERDDSGRRMPRGEARMGRELKGLGIV